MATMSTADLLDVFKNMTVLELNEFLKAFEEEFGVTAAAPVAAAAPAAARWRRRRGRGRGEGRVRRRPHRRRRQEDPGHQGGALAHQPRPQGGQGPGRRRARSRCWRRRRRKTPRRQRPSSKGPAPPSSSSNDGRNARHGRRPDVADRSTQRLQPGGPRRILAATRTRCRPRNRVHQRGPAWRVLCSGLAVSACSCPAFLIASRGVLVCPSDVPSALVLSAASTGLPR